MFVVLLISHWLLPDLAQWQRDGVFKSPVERLLADTGHGTNGWIPEGPDRVLLTGQSFDDVVNSTDPDTTGQLIKAMNGGEMDSEQFCVVDLALWCRATGLSRSLITVLGTPQRPVNSATKSAIAKSWTRWLAAGQPCIKKGDYVLPKLEGYPDVSEVFN
jgi:hypothetical protein